MLYCQQHNIGVIVRGALAMGILTGKFTAETQFEEVDVGLLHVNQPTVGVEYQVPFGGTKVLGYDPKEQGWSTLDFYSDWQTRVVRP